MDTRLESDLKACREYIEELEAEVQKLKELLHTASGSDYKWPESFKVQVNAALENEEC